MLAVRQEAKAKSPVSLDGMFPVSWLPKRAQSLVFSWVKGMLALSFRVEHAWGAFDPLNWEGLELIFSRLTASGRFTGRG